MEGWCHGCNTGNNGFMCDFMHGQEQVSSEIQSRLNQISMQMEMEEEVYMPAANAMPEDLVALHHGARGGSLQSSSSSSLRSLSGSPESSAHLLAMPTTACHYTEVSSHWPLEPIRYDHHQYMSLHVPTPPIHGMAAMAADVSTSAFNRYVRHLSPRKMPKGGACGQRMIKTVMSVLARMYMMRFDEYYLAAPAPPPPPPVNQLQHMMSERKRREKLNESFDALKTVLPPGSKKDKTSILIRAKEYVNSLKSQVSELEEKNQMLESRLCRRCDDGNGNEDDDSGENIKIQIKRVAEECAIYLRIAVRTNCNTTDVVLTTLQCLKGLEDVSLVAMSTNSTSLPRANTFPRASFTLQLKPSVKWGEELLKESVAKAVTDALLRSETETLQPSPSFQRASRDPAR